MRKVCTYALAIAALLIAGTAGVSAQHYFGIRAGYGGGTSRLYPQTGFENGTVWGLYSGGVSWKYYTAEPYVGGIEVDAMFMQQGFKTVILNNVTAEKESAYERYVNTVMVPICWQPHVYMFKQRMRVFLNAGVTFSYVVSSKEKNISYVNDTSEERDYRMKLTRDNRLGYGLVGGGGASWSTGRLEVFAEARYYIGYSDILKNWNKYEENPYLRSPLDGLQLSAGVFWRFGKSGIKSAQGRRTVSEDVVRGMISPGVPSGPEVDATTNEKTGAKVAADEDAGNTEKSRRERRRESKKPE